MAAEYPGAIPTIAADKSNSTTMSTDHPGHHNKLAEEVVAIATELGTNPSGASSTVADAIAGKQASDADLTAIAALTSAADKVPYSTGAQAWALADFTAAARALLDDADAAAMRTTLGAQASDATLTALAGLATGADKVPYSTGTDTFSEATLTTFGRSLIDDADAAEARATLAAPGFISIGSDATAVTGTSYADAASGLNITVANGVPVRFQYIIAWVPSAASVGARFSLNGPTITRLAYSVRWNTTATVVTQSPLGTSYDQAFTVGSASDAANNLAIVEGVLVPGASGTLALRSAAETAGGTVTVKAGSSVIYW